MNNEILKSEKVVVALMIKDVKYIREVTTRGLDSRYFGDQILKYFFELTCEYYSQHKSVMTESVLVDSFKTHNRSQEERNVIVGKYKILATANVNENDFSYHAEKLLNSGIEKDMMSTVKKVVEHLKTSAPDKVTKASETLMHGALKVARINNSKAVITIRDLVDDYNIIEQNIVNRNQHPELYQGARCYIDEIDKITGGFRPGELVLFCAETGGGKTTTMMNIAHGIYKPRRTSSMKDSEWKKARNNGHNVLYINLEVPEDMFGLKLTAMDARVPFNALAEGILNKGRIEAIIEAKNERKNIKSKFKVMHVVQQKRINTGDIESYIKEIYTYFQPSVVCVDYLDLIEPVNKGDNKRERSGLVCEELRAIGNKYGFCTVSLAQINREAIKRTYKGKEVDMQLTDVSESSLIANTCDYVFGCQADRECDDKMWMFLLKGRNTGKVPKFHLVWIRSENWIGSSGTQFAEKESSNITEAKRDSFLQISKELSNKKPEDIRRENAIIIEKSKQEAKNTNISSMMVDDEDFFISDKSSDDIFDQPQVPAVIQSPTPIVKEEKAVKKPDVVVERIEIKQPPVDIVVPKPDTKFDDDDNIEDDLFGDEEVNEYEVEDTIETVVVEETPKKELDSEQSKVADEIMNILNNVSENAGSKFIDADRRKDW